MSTPASHSYEIDTVSPANLTKQLGSSILNEYVMSVSEDTPIEVTADGVASIDTTGITLCSRMQTGTAGEVHTDTYEYAKTLYDFINHETCTTGETDGYPVWFENAAWCNNCLRLLNADDRFIGEVDCPTCDAEYPRGGLMRATAPAVLEFEERVEFQSPATSVEELQKELSHVFGVKPRLTA